MLQLCSIIAPKMDYRCILRSTCVIAHIFCQACKLNEKWYFYMIPPLLIISIQKIKHIDWFFPVIFLIKESCILIQLEVYLATSNQKWQSHILPSPED